MARRHYNNGAAPTTTTASITSGATSFSVADLSSYPASLPYVLAIDSDNASFELVLVTAASGSTITTCTRGYDGTAAQAHAASATVEHVASAIDYDEANAHVNATSGIHGVTGALVGTTDAQTLANKTLTTPTVNGGTITGATISGGAASPASVAASGAVSGATLASTGDTTVGGNANVTGAVNATGQLKGGSILGGRLFSQINFSGDGLQESGTFATQLINGTKEFDTLSAVITDSSSPNSAVKIPTTGVYKVWGQVSTDSTSGRQRFGITKNSTAPGAYLASSLQPCSDGNSTTTVLAPKYFSFNANDIIRAFFVTTSGFANVMAGGTAPDSYLVVERIS